MLINLACLGTTATTTCAAPQEPQVVTERQLLIGLRQIMKPYKQSRPQITPDLSAPPATSVNAEAVSLSDAMDIIMGLCREFGPELHDLGVTFEREPRRSLSGQSYGWPIQLPSAPSSTSKTK